jgi:hypothetical protein
MPLQNYPLVKPTPMVLPTKDYPWLKRLINEVDFACATCSSAQGQAVYYTLKEAHREPVSAAPTSHSGSIIAQGMVATRFLVMCPTCRTVPENNPLMPGGFCDLMDIDPNYKRPFRAAGTDGDGLTMDGDEEADGPSVVSREPQRFASRRLKKKTDLNKLSRQAPAARVPVSAPGRIPNAAVVRLSAEQQRLVKLAEKSNKEEVPADAVALAKGAKGAKAPKKK